MGTRGKSVPGDDDLAGLDDWYPVLGHLFSLKPSDVELLTLHQLQAYAEYATTWYEQQRKGW